VNRLANRIIRLEKDTLASGSGALHRPYEPEHILVIVEGQPPSAWVLPQSMVASATAEKEAIVAHRRAQGNRVPYALTIRVARGGYTLQVQDGPHLMANLSNEELDLMDAYLAPEGPGGPRV